mmetsp:Transcript_40698/g.113072  ORF Transcript_40698/g.113072 Transcript_40698/m.113072 type:complete len:233 (+) Transcript_40698:1022-1720(+)
MKRNNNSRANRASITTLRAAAGRFSKMGGSTVCRMPTPTVISMKIGVRRAYQLAALLDSGSSRKFHNKSRQPPICLPSVMLLISDADLTAVMLLTTEADLLGSGLPLRTSGGSCLPGEFNGDVWLPSALNLRRFSMTCEASDSPEPRRNSCNRCVSAFAVAPVRGDKVRGEILKGSWSSDSWLTLCGCMPEAGTFASCGAVVQAVDADVSEGLCSSWCRFSPSTALAIWAAV